MLSGFNLRGPDSHRTILILLLMVNEPVTETFNVFHLRHWAEFRSFIDPLIIMLAVPLGQVLIGVS